MGYISEVDLEYPSELHDLHKDYPLASEKLEISQNIFSKYYSETSDQYGIKVGGVKYKEKDLQLYFSLRMKLTKVHRILKLKQSHWLKKYIDFNRDKRKNAANSFEKDFLKLMNNSVFGKTMENFQKRINVELINNAKDYIRYVSRPHFFSQKIFSKNFLAVHKIKPVLILNKPIYVGFSILE